MKNIERCHTITNLLVNIKELLSLTMCNQQVSLVLHKVPNFSPKILSRLEFLWGELLVGFYFHFFRLS